MIKGLRLYRWWCSLLFSAPAAVFALPVMRECVCECLPTSHDIISIVDATGLMVARGPLFLHSQTMLANSFFLMRIKYHASKELFCRFMHPHKRLSICMLPLFQRSFGGVAHSMQDNIYCRANKNSFKLYTIRRM